METMVVVHYAKHSSDGLDDHLWCVDGAVHVCATREAGHGFIAVHKSRINGGACDGSCRPDGATLDLAARIAKMREEQLQDGEPILQGEQVVGFTGPLLPSTVELDAASVALAERGMLVGRLLARFYAKRSGESEDWCVGGMHLRMATSFDWWSGANNGVYKSHRLTAKPCDGSCAPRLVTDPAQLAAARAALEAE